MNKTLAYILAVSCILIAYIFACCTFAFVKIEKNQRNLLEKSGNGPKLLFFPSAERVVPYDTIFFEVQKMARRHSAERVVPFSVAGAVLAQESIVFSTVLSVLYLTLCGRRS